MSSAAEDASANAHELGAESGDTLHASSALFQESPITHLAEAHLMHIAGRSDNIDIEARLEVLGQARRLLEGVLRGAEAQLPSVSPT